MARPARLAGLLLALVAVIATAGGARAQGYDAGEVVVRLQALQEEVARLRGEVEELRFRQRQLEQALAAGGPAAPPPHAASAPPPSVPGVAPPVTAGGGTLGGGVPGPGTVLDQPDIPHGYDRGMALLQAGRWAEAEAELARFVEANPDDPRAPEAAFWAADTLFVRGDYAAAAAAFAGNYRTYGAEAPYAPDSLLKVAMALIEVGDRERACQTLDQLRQRHPDVGRALGAGIERERARAGCG
jgi:tol-pal system protein YbgF